MLLVPALWRSSYMPFYFHACFLFSESFKFANYKTKPRRVSAAIGDALRRMPQRVKRINERAGRLLSGKTSRSEKCLSTPTEYEDSDWNVTERVCLKSVVLWEMFIWFCNIFAVFIVLSMVQLY